MIVKNACSLIKLCLFIEIKISCAPLSVLRVTCNILIIKVEIDIENTSLKVFCYSIFFMSTMFLDFIANNVECVKHSIVCACFFYCVIFIVIFFFTHYTMNLFHKTSIKFIIISILIIIMIFNHKNRKNEKNEKIKLMISIKCINFSS